MVQVIVLASPGLSLFVRPGFRLACFPFLLFLVRLLGGLVLTWRGGRWWRGVPCFACWISPSRRLATVVTAGRRHI